MDIATEITETKKKQAETVEQLKKLRQQFQQQEQQLIQEIIRLDGEIRGFSRLSKDGDKGK